MFLFVLRVCVGLRECLGVGEKVYGRIVKSGVDGDDVIEMFLLCMYG